MKRLLLLATLLLSNSAFAADTSLSNLSAGAAVGATDLFYNVQSAGSGGVKTTAAQVKTFTSASPTLVTPVLGVATGTSIALGGCTISTNAFCVTGTTALAATTVTTSFTATGLVTLADHATQATNTVIGNATSGVASPTALAVGTCSTAGSALIWTTNTGFGCNTSITAAAVPASGLTGTTLAANVVTSSLTSVGTLTSLLSSGAIKTTGAEGSQFQLALGGQEWDINMVTASSFYVNDKTNSKSPLVISANTSNSVTIGTSTVAVVGASTFSSTVGLLDTSAAHYVQLTATSSAALTADRALTINMENVAHILTFGTTANTGNGIVFQNAATSTVAALDIADQMVTGGTNVTSATLGTISSGTTTIDCGTRPLQYLTNGGAFTIAAPAADGSCIILVTNNGSAGAITFSGFSVGSNTGDAYVTTNTNKFSLYIWEINGTAGYRWAAHQ